METRKKRRALGWKRQYRLFTESPVLSASVVLATLVFVTLVIPSGVNALSFTYSHSITAPPPGGQGLESDGTNLFYEAGNKIYTIDSNNGQVINSFTISINLAALGLAYNSTSNTLFVIDSSYAGAPGSPGFPGIPTTIYEINPTNGSILHSFTMSGAITGATFFNGNLYLADINGFLLVLDPSNGSLLNSYQIVGGVGGLTTYGSSLIGAEQYNGSYVELDPYTGSILSSFTIPFSLTPNQGVRGLASDGTELFATSFDYSGTSVIDVYSPSGPSQAVPEPTTFILLGSGLVGLIGFRSRLKNSRKHSIARNPKQP